MRDLLRQQLHHHLAQLFDRNRVVVWSDDSGLLGSLLREQLPTGVTMPAFEGNLLSVRQVIDKEDPWLERKWLLYAPGLPESVGLEFLADYVQGFYTVEQGNLAWALHSFFQAPETPELRSLLRGPVAGRLAAEFGRWVPPSRGQLAEEEVLLSLFRAALNQPAITPIDVVLRFLASGDEEKTLAEAGLLPTLTTFIKRFLGLRRHLVDGNGPDRGPLARCLLASALVEMKAAEARPLANHLPQEAFRPTWSQGLLAGLRDPVLSGPLASAIDEAIRGSDLLLELKQPVALARGPALPALDRRIFQLLLESRPTELPQTPGWWRDAAELAEIRLGFVTRTSHAGQSWCAVRAASRLLLRVKERIEELSTYPAACFGRLAQEYARGEAGDWQIDAFQRGLPQGTPKLPPEFETVLFGPAREAYQKWVREQTRRFVRAAEVESILTDNEIPSQRRFWSEMVDRSGSRAILVVDALRADLAHELAGRLASREVKMRFVLAELPTRTEVGMAALLPRAEQSFEVRVERGRIIPFIGSTGLPSVTERRRHLETVALQQGRKLVRADLADFLKDDGKLLRSCRERGETAIAFTTDLDEGGEMAARVSFQLLNEILENCVDYVERAFESDFAEVVVAADHGFLVRSGETADPGVPGVAQTGDRFARGLRYAIGNGEAGPNLAALPAAKLGRVGDEVYVPRDSACVGLPGGPGLFVHGGLSPQEAVLVFLQIKPGASSAVVLPVSLQTQEQVLSLTFKVFVIMPGVDRPFLYSPRTVVVRILDGSGQPIPFEETLTIEPKSSEVKASVLISVPAGGEYTVTLNEAETGRRLAAGKTKVEVLGDDFGF